MTKFLLDLGANNGCSLRKFSNELEDFSEYQVFSFEPGSVGRSKEMKDTLSKSPNVKFFNQPVSDQAKLITFYEHTSNSCASTTWEKKAKDKSRVGSCGSNIKGEILEHEVESIDLANFISKNILSQNPSRLILKVDIEGEEYRVIPHLLENEIFSHVSELYIEWHGEWNTTAISEKALESQIRVQNPSIKIREWNALGF